MEQLVGAHHSHSHGHGQHHSLSPRTPTRPHPLLQHLPSHRLRDHQIHHPPAAAAAAAPRLLRFTPPFFLLLLASVYLLASLTILSAPTPSLRRLRPSPRPLLLPMPATSSAPGFFELDNGRIRARVTNVGAAVTSLLVPDKNGVLADVVLGFDSLDPYLVGVQSDRIRAEITDPVSYPMIFARVQSQIQIVPDIDMATDNFGREYRSNTERLRFRKALAIYLILYVIFLNGTSPYFGCIVGRVANRIKEGKFSLYGVQHNLSINNPPNTLHGGFKGFDKAIWEVAAYNKGDNPSITFKYYSKDGEEGYPGDVSVTARYSLLPSMALTLDMEAVPLNRATPISLAQHTYWNLAGHNSGDVLAHSVQIWGSQITPVDQTSIPTGEFMPVRDTPFDFLTPTKIGSRIDQVPGGYDHNYVLDDSEVRSGLRHVAEVTDPLSTRVLNIWANAPGVQFYTGNFLDGVVGKGGAIYGKHAGLCLETQGFPNAVNQPNFPSVIVRPGEHYRHTMMYEFSTE